MKKILFALFLAVLAAASLPVMSAFHGQYTVLAAGPSGLLTISAGASGPSDTPGSGAVPEAAPYAISGAPLFVKIAAGLVFLLFVLLAVLPVISDTDPRMTAGVTK